MTGDFENALRLRVEEAIDREVEHLRGLLELRLTVLIREVLAERLPACKRPRTVHPGLDLHDLTIGSRLACRDEDNDRIVGA